MAARSSFLDVCNQVGAAGEFHCRALFHTDGRIELAAGHREFYLVPLWSGTWLASDEADPDHLSRRPIPVGTVSAPYLFTNGSLGSGVAIIEHAGEIFIFVERSHMKSGPAVDLPPVDFLAGPLQEAFRIPAGRFRAALNAIVDVFEAYSPLTPIADKRFVFSAVIEIDPKNVLNFGLFDPSGTSPSTTPSWVLTKNLSVSDKIAS